MRESSLWTGGTRIVARVQVARLPWDRMRGLLGRGGLPADEAMLLDPCAAVHTLGMRFAIDVVFLDRQWRVVRAHRAVPPGRWWVGGGPAAARALEVASGWLPPDALPVGAVVRLAPVS